MKTVTIKVGQLLVGKFKVKEHALITSLVMNDDMRIITKMPLALRLNEPFTIIATEGEETDGTG